MKGGTAAESVPRVVFSADQLPTELGAEARYNLWRDVYSATYVELDYSRLEDRPFTADFEFLPFGPVGVGQFSSTVSRIQRTRANIAIKPRDHICVALVRRPLGLTQLGRELLIPPGGMTLTNEGEPMLASCPQGGKWLLLDIPRDLLRAHIPDVEDLVATQIAESPASRHLRNYVTHLLETDVENDPALVASIGEQLVDLVSLALGARGDEAEAEVAGKRGLRAARLREVLREIERRFMDPGVSAISVGRACGLSARYVNDLLHEIGTTLTERVLERRLQAACVMLADPRHDGMRIGVIADACGFNDISYFNRCFRRRFGASPTQFRGGRRD
jgi:AraC-like DNA-binding protein